MGDKVILVVAEDGDELVAGALNLIGGDTLFGRLWGCHPRTYYPSLHFEACYYQVYLLGWKTFRLYICHNLIMTINSLLNEFLLGTLAT